MPQEAAAKGVKIRLKPAQERVLAALSASGEQELTRAEYEQLAGVSRSQAAYDLAELVEAGLLQRLGSGRATRYRLRPDEPATQRRWTQDRIWAELVQFCDGRRTWPSPREFKEAGRGDLYVAASRYGGVAHWARALGVEQAPRNAPSPPSPPRRAARLRTKLAWAGAGALATIALAGATVVAVGLVRQPAPAVRAPHVAAAPAGGGVADESLHPFRSPAAAIRPRAARVRHATRPATERRAIARAVRRTRTDRSVVAQTTSIAQTAPTSSPVAAKTWLSSAPAHTTPPSSGPSPLAAPPATQAPAPIKAP